MNVKYAMFNKENLSKMKIPCIKDCLWFSMLFSLFSPQTTKQRQIFFCQSEQSQGEWKNTSSKTFIGLCRFWHQRCEKQQSLTVMFSRSRCLLWTVSQSLRIFSFTRLISLAVNWSATESSCSSSSSLIISSRQDRSRSIFSRSRLSMYIRDAVQRARFYQIQKNSKRKRRKMFLS